MCWHTQTTFTQSPHPPWSTPPPTSTHKPQLSSPKAPLHPTNLFTQVLPGTRSAMIAAMMVLPDAQEDGFLLMLTEKGFIKKTALSQFVNHNRSRGLSAIKLRVCGDVFWGGVIGGCFWLLLCCCCCFLWVWLFRKVQSFFILMVDDEGGVGTWGVMVGGSGCIGTISSHSLSLTHTHPPTHTHTHTRTHTLTHTHVHTNTGWGQVAGSSAVL